MAFNLDDPLLLLSAHRPPSSSPAITDADCYRVDATQIGRASAGSQNDGFPTGGYDAGLISDAKHGNVRPEFRQNALVGTVGLYERHVFLCYKNPQVWPPRIDAAEFDRLPRLLAATLAARKPDMNRETRLTICEGHDGSETSNGDVLIFPDMIRYRRLTHFDVNTFVEEVLVKDGEWLPGTPEALRGWYIFVCCHGSRDQRCGVCGPSVISKFKNEIVLRGLEGKVSVSPCSHIGGHKYAGNVIIFGPNIKMEVTGHWYGYVMPEDVPLLLEQHIGKGEIVDSLWRGQMGLSEEFQKKSQELRFQVSSGSRSMCTSRVEGTGCCQAVDGSFSCCQDTGLQEMRRGPDSREVAKNRSKKQALPSKCCKGIMGSHKMCSMPTWYESWEREDTYAVLAVIGAAISVVLACRCFKQLS